MGVAPDVDPPSVAALKKCSTRHARLDGRRRRQILRIPRTRCDSGAVGFGLSFTTFLEVARIAVPTFAEALIGRGERAEHDRRLHQFARRVVARARIRLTVVGADNVPLDRAFVYMSNHQSHIDIPVLYATVPSQSLRMVAKAELFRIPGFGRAMRAADFIEVDRGDRARAVDSLRRAAATVASGVSVWIAPEGHRSSDGRLGPLKKGGFHLARDTGAPIVPVALSGTRNVLPPGARSMAHDVPVRVVFGAPIPIDAPIPDLMERVRAFLEANVTSAAGRSP
jgi:1-acyl-sn-glycerol-3-phosphate acyltransferase